MKVISIGLCFLAISTGLTACGGGGDDDTPAANSGIKPSVPVESTAEGVTKALNNKTIPILNTDSGLSIKDINSNGVRDDIDKLISDQYKSSTDVKAATQFAQAVQMSVSQASPTADSIPVILDSTTKAVDCASAQMGISKASQMMDDLTSATANTKDRLLAYRAAQIALSGQHAVVTEEDPKSFCK